MCIPRWPTSCPCGAAPRSRRRHPPGASNGCNSRGPRCWVTQRACVRKNVETDRAKLKYLAATIVRTRNNTSSVCGRRPLSFPLFGHFQGRHPMRRLLRHHRQVRKPREGPVIRQNSLHFFQVAILSPIALYKAVQQCATICDCEARNRVPILPLAAISHACTIRRAARHDSLV